MPDQFQRTTLLYGTDKMNLIYKSKVAVFGIGGVGGHCAEALARSGIGAIDLIDSDIISVSNINRQIIATHRTVGQYKADVMRERILEINPLAEVRVYKLFYLPETADEIDLSVYDYVIDAIDTMAAKIELVCRAKACGTPIISSMGAANKFDTTAFEVADIYETSICPVARVMRYELRKRGIDSLKVVYSKEQPAKPDYSNFAEEPDNGGSVRKQRNIPASNAFVPPAAGLVIAGEVIRDLTL